MKMHNPPHVGELISETLVESNIDIATFAKMLDAELSFTQQLVDGQIKLMSNWLKNYLQYLEAQQNFG